MELNIVNNFECTLYMFNQVLLNEDLPNYMSNLQKELNMILNSTDYKLFTKLNSVTIKGLHQYMDIDICIDSAYEIQLEGFTKEYITYDQALIASYSNTFYGLKAFYQELNQYLNNEHKIPLLPAFTSHLDYTTIADLNTSKLNIEIFFSIGNE